MEKTKALWHLTSGSSSLEETFVGNPDQDFCQVKTHYSLISPGTERLVASGIVPEPLYEQMKVPYMEGSLGLPVKYGYSLVGKVLEGPESLKNKMVHLLHPHQEMCLVAVSDLFEIPAGVPPFRATLASNLETVVNAIWDAGISLGDRVLITGFGIIGGLLAYLLQKIPGCKVEVADINQEKLEKARNMDINAYFPDEITGGFDYAFNTSGSGTGLQLCIDSTGKEGHIIELSWYGNKSVHLHLGGTFHSYRKSIVSSQVATLPAGHQAMWNLYRRKELVFELLHDEKFDQFLSNSIAFGELPSLFEQIRQGNYTAFTWLVKY